MKINLTILALFISVFASAQSSNFDWVKREGGGNSEVGKKIRRAYNGDLYTVMYFTNSTIVDGNTITALSGSFSNYLLIKYDANGAYQWYKHMYCTESFTAPEFDIDGSGNLYLAATFGGTITFCGNSYTHYSTWGDAQCLFKLNSSGSLLFGGIVTRTTGVGGYIKMGVKSTGEVVLSGWIPEGDTLKINGQNYNVTNTEGKTFYAFFNNNGTYNWHSINETGFIWANSIKFDNTGSYIYVNGTHTEAHTFANNGASIPAPIGGSDFFLAKIQAFGFAHCVWAKSFGSLSSEEIGQIEIDDNNNIILTGTVSSNCTIYGNTITNTGGVNLLVLGFNSSGTCIFAKSIAKAVSVYIPELKKDNAGYVYLSGSYTDSIVFDDLSKKISIGGNDAIIIKVKATNGSFQWSKTFGSNSNDWTTACAFNQNELYATGRFSNIANFGTFQYTSFGGTDFFLAKLSGCDFPTINVSYFGNTTLCNDDSLVLRATEVFGANYQWLNNNLPLQNENKDSLIVSASGLYSVDVDLGGVCRDTFGFVNITISAINAIIQSQSPSICVGSTMPLYTSIPYNTYSWSTGANTASITISSQGSYSVTVSNAAGCEDSASIMIGEYPSPPTPTILIGTNCILASGDIQPSYSYKWRLNGNIVGGNVAYLNANLYGNGFYTLEITDGNGCKATSNPPQDVGCSTYNIGENATKHDLFKVYPQPVSDFIFIEKKDDNYNEVKAILFDETGRQLATELIFKNGQNEDRINISDYRLGVYLLRLETKKWSQIIKIIKL